MDVFARDAPTWDELDARTWDEMVSDGSWDSAETGGPPAVDAIDDALDDALDALIRLDIRRAQLAAQEMELLVRVAGVAERRREVIVAEEETDSERLLSIADEVREEVSAALRRSPTTVHNQLVDARLLFGPLRRTLDALAAGRITEGHARVIAEQGEILHRSLSADDQAFTDACTALQDRVLVRAESGSRAQLRRLAKAAVAAIDAAGEQDRRRAARAAEDVRIQPDDYGLSVLTARLQTVDAERIRAALEGHAASDALVTPCDATLGQRRVTALLDLVCGKAGTWDQAVTHGIPDSPVPVVGGVEINVVFTLDEVMRGEGAVAGLLENSHVPLTLRRLITDPLTGRALDLGRRRYVVSEPLRRWIVARDRTCRFPGCSRRASACQVDHVIAWTDDGGTDEANLQPLCTRHHQLKTHGGWRVRRDHETGLTVWTSPTGRTYGVDPVPVLAPGVPPPAAAKDPPAAPDPPLTPHPPAF